jgi:hypothetical protein
LKSFHLDTLVSENQQTYRKMAASSESFGEETPMTIRIDDSENGSAEDTQPAGATSAEQTVPSSDENVPQPAEETKQEEKKSGGCGRDGCNCEGISLTDLIGLAALINVLKEKVKRDETPKLPPPHGEGCECKPKKRETSKHEPTKQPEPTQSEPGKSSDEEKEFNVKRIFINALRAEMKESEKFIDVSIKDVTDDVCILTCERDDSEPPCCR